MKSHASVSNLSLSLLGSSSLLRLRLPPRLRSRLSSRPLLRRSLLRLRLRLLPPLLRSRDLLRLRGIQDPEIRIETPSDYFIYFGVLAGWCVMKSTQVFLRVKQRCNSCSCDLEFQITLVRGITCLERTVSTGCTGAPIGSFVSFGSRYMSVRLRLYDLCSVSSFAVLLSTLQKIHLGVHST